MTWIDPDLHLTGEGVALLPMHSHHFDELIALAADPRIWEFYAVEMGTEAQVRNRLSIALAEREAGLTVPFVIQDRRSGRLAGSTRYMTIEASQRKLEIGWTWLHPDHWATALNPESKMLLLTHAFESLQAVRVQLKTDERNQRSRKAILKIGARFEGILRNDLIRENGTLRHSAYFSIIESEWPETKAALIHQIQLKRNSAYE